ncbi:MAG: IS1096 element passenger TnpR family protein [bacterium]
MGPTAIWGNSGWAIPAGAFAIRIGRTDVRRALHDLATAGNTQSGSDTSTTAIQPRIIPSCRASGRCPPEDVGGPSGYEEFVEALGDPDHESHDMFTE